MNAEDVKRLLADLVKQMDDNRRLEWSGHITWHEAQRRADKAGKITGKKILEFLREWYPDGQVPEADALDIIPPALKKTYEYVVGLAAAAQEETNKAAGVGLKPVTPTFDDKRAVSLAKSVAEREDIAQAAGEIENQVKANIRHVIDEAILLNAEAHERAGLAVTVTRIYDDVGVHNRKDPCEWCLSRCGSAMSLAEAQAKDSFARHPGCGCTIIYTSARGKTTKRVGGGWWQDV